MPNTFLRDRVRNISTVTTIYTVPASTTAVVVGILVANVDASATVNATVDISSGGSAYNLIKAVPILPGASIEIVEGKIILETTDVIRLTSTGGLCDAWISYMEIT